MGEDDVRKEIQELRDQMEALSGALDRIAKPYGQLFEYLERFQGIAKSYFRVLDLYQKYGSVSPEIVIPGLKDPISKEIVKALFEKGDRNISQITEAVKARRGTASRRIVRDRLEALERDGVVVASGQGKVRTFSVSQAVVEKWSQVLGLAKSQEQRTEERGEP
ncbi:MAG TPA: ArsR family transcriptional regulator [Thermoplasmata archaeon]|nr:ArsR family transcriptional regulator [Thermoplasmata archaeon]